MRVNSISNLPQRSVPSFGLRFVENEESAKFFRDYTLKEKKEFIDHVSNFGEPRDRVEITGVVRRCKVEGITDGPYDSPTYKPTNEVNLLINGQQAQVVYPHSLSGGCFYDPKTPNRLVILVQGIGRLLDNCRLASTQKREDMDGRYY